MKSRRNAVKREERIASRARERGRVSNLRADKAVPSPSSAVTFPPSRALPAATPASDYFDRRLSPQASASPGRAPIEAALQSRRPADVKAIGDFSYATEAEKLQLIAILLDQIWVGGHDEAALRAIWASIGDRMISVASANLKLWRDCIVRGAGLDDLPQVEALREAFRGDVRAVATDNLARNHVFVLGELQRLEQKPATAAAKPAPDMGRLQTAAAVVAKLQKAQEAVRGKVVVGFDQVPFADGPTPSFAPSLFDPDRPPQFAENPMSFGLPTMKVTPYAEVKQLYDAVDEQLRRWLAAFPTLYAIARQNRSADTQSFAELKDPGTAQSTLVAALRALISDIEGAQDKLKRGDLDPLDLTPVQARLLAGVPAASGVDWRAALPSEVGHKLVEGRQFNRALRDLGFTLPQALILLAPLTGGASLIAALTVVGVGLSLGAQGAKTYLSIQEAARLEQASKTGALPGTELVTRSQADWARAEMMADIAALALTAIPLALEGGLALGSRAMRGAVQNMPPQTPALMEGASGGRAKPPMDFRFVGANEATGEMHFVGRSNTGEYAHVLINGRSGDGVLTWRGQTHIIARGRLLPELALAERGALARTIADDPALISAFRKVAPEDTAIAQRVSAAVRQAGGDVRALRTALGDIARIAAIPRRVSVAPDLYEPLRRIAGGIDIDRIASQTGLPRAEVEAAKRNLMLDEHILVDDTGVLYRGRFDAYEDVANIWGRAARSEALSDADKLFLQRLVRHEFAEGRLLGSNGRSLEEAFLRGELEGKLRDFLSSRGWSASKITKLLADEPKPVTPYRYAHIVAALSGAPNP